MLSINLSRFNGLILVLIITATSGIGAYTLAEIGQTRPALAQAPVPAHIPLAPVSVQPANLAVNDPAQAPVDESQQCQERVIPLAMSRQRPNSST